MEKRRGLILAAVIWAFAAGVLMLGARTWLPPLASEHGAGVDAMIHFTLSATGGLILLGHVVLGFLIWKFSGRSQVSFRLAEPRIERRWSLAAALLMAAIAEGGVLVIGLPVWAKVYDTAPPANALIIEVTTEQFGWNVRYAGPDGVFGRTDPKLYSLDNVLGQDPADPAGRDDIIDLNMIHAEVNRPVLIRLHSKDVLHSFFLPNLRVKQDSVPGMRIDFWFVPNKTGSFELACAELCGLGHYEMRGVLVVMTPEELKKWLEEKKNG
jgi:cytochrome c oxidase subunit 2